MGRIIKAARKAAGMTQKELGEKLGISYQCIAQWENDLRNPKFETRKRIAEVLGIPIRQLIPEATSAEFDFLDVALDESKKGQMIEIEKIRKMLTEDELLCQLAEEAAELSQAALKLRRALTGVNPTPVSYPDAREKLLEEYGDVLNSVEAIITPTENAYAVDLRMQKRKRWVKRLEAHYGT